MYGENKVNPVSMNLRVIKSRASDLDMEIYNQTIRNYTTEDILQLAQQSQEITDMLNQLYEQMKGN